MKIEWNAIGDKQPPKDKSVLIKFFGGVIAMGRERYGNLGEPQQSEFAWRCDCCGRFAHKIVGWCDLEED